MTEEEFEIFAVSHFAGFMSVHWEKQSIHEERDDWKAQLQLMLAQGPDAPLFSPRRRFTVASFILHAKRTETEELTLRGCSWWDLADKARDWWNPNKSVAVTVDPRHLARLADAFGQLAGEGDPVPDDQKAAIMAALKERK